jgi:soluble lytic murein transglycosylase
MLRAGEIEAFENELPIFVKTSGNRIAPVLIAYAMKKRRDGDINESLETLQRVLADYPSVREEALWAIGWTQYIAGDYEKARETLSQMTSSYTDPRYVYWKTKCSELLGDTKSPKTTSVKEGGHRDFYAILSLLKDNRSPKKINRNALKPITTTGLSEKTDALAELGFKSEAVFELIYQARRSTEQRETIAISAYLKRLGEEKMSINIVTKVPYREEIHELYYPLSYWAFVEEAAGKNGVDPLLVLSVIREESRFDPQARSIAGALGLMQLMPQTAARFSRHALKAHKLPANLQDARLNIQIGTYYLSQLLKTFQSIPPALAAYNAGEDAVKSWLSRGNYKTVDEFIEDIPYDETRNYVKRVLNTYFEYLRASEGMDLEKTRKQLGAL